MLRVACYGLRVACCGLRVTRCGLRGAGCGLEGQIVSFTKFVISDLWERLLAAMVSV